MKVNHTQKLFIASFFLLSIVISLGSCTKLAHRIAYGKNDKSVKNQKINNDPDEVPVSEDGVPLKEIKPIPVSKTTSTTQKIQVKSVIQYQYKVFAGAAVYADSTLSVRLGNLPQDAFVTTTGLSFGEILSPVKAVEYQKKRVYVQTGSVYYHAETKVNLYPDGRYDYAPLVVISAEQQQQLANSQNKRYGFGTFFTTKSALLLEGYYQNGQNIFGVGYLYQIQGQLGKADNTPATNYGQTVTASGQYFNALDLTYGRFLNSRWAVLANLSVGSRKNFTNYSDKRFKSGGYHSTFNPSPIAGLGLSGLYQAKDWLNIHVGYNTLSKVSFGASCFF